MIKKTFEKDGLTFEFYGYDDETKLADMRCEHCGSRFLVPCHWTVCHWECCPVCEAENTNIMDF